MENWAKPCTTHTHVHGPVNGLYVNTGKNGRRPSWTERDARHGKLGKTMYDAHARTRTREQVREVQEKKGPYAMETGSKLANDGQETVPWQRKHGSWQKNAATAAFQNSVPLQYKLKGRGPKGG